MRDPIRKNRSIIAAAVLFSIVILFICIQSYADEKKTAANETQNKEILVARDVTLGPPLWCGDDKFVVSSERLGLRWIDFLNNKTIKIHSNAYVGGIDWTPDCEWLVYVDTRSGRYDKGSEEKSVYDFSRYNFKTGKHQKFAIARGGGKWSPDGKRFLFNGIKPKSRMDQPDPKWNLVWSQKDWPTGKGFDSAWLGDSSGVVIINDDKFYIERYEGNKSVQLQPLQVNVDLGDIWNLKVDKLNRIYVLSRPKLRKEGKTLMRCQISGNILQCKKIIKEGKEIIVYDITPEGENIVFREERNECAWLLREGSSNAECINPFVGAMVSFSNNGKWLSFVRPRLIEKVRGTDVYTDDLYVIKVAGE